MNTTLEQFLDACSTNTSVLLYVLDDNTAETICKLQLDHVDIIALRRAIPQLMDYHIASISAVDGTIYADICKEDK